ncbi:uncharacterized protein O3C94_015327 isoform 2-T2 [Discoglossus pictus]
MGSFYLWLALSCLLVSTHGSPLECEELKQIPPNLTQINGVWNMIAISTTDMHNHLKVISYLFIDLSATENELNMTAFFNPMAMVFLGLEGSERISDQKETLSYKEHSQRDDHVITLFQTHAEDLIVLHLGNNTLRMGFLYSKNPSLPESEIKRFEKWSECKNLHHFRKYDNSMNYAKECFHVLKDTRELDAIKGTVKWPLVAKASNYPDPHYIGKIVYKGWLAISRNGLVYTVQEKLSESETVWEVNFDQADPKGPVRMTVFETEKGLLLLGIKNNNKKVIYLASKIAKASLSVLKEFEKQALCFETSHFYSLADSIKAEKPSLKDCADIEKRLFPMNFEQSTGLWSLTASAYYDVDVALQELRTEYAWMQTKTVNGKPHLTYSAIQDGSLIRHEKDNIEEIREDGHVKIRDNVSLTNVTMYLLGSDCILHTFETPAHIKQFYILFCRSNPVPSEHIKTFSVYSHCNNAPNIVIRSQASALSCSDLPNEVKEIDLEKIAGRWDFVVAAAASDYPIDISVTRWIQFDVQDEEVTVVIMNDRVNATKDGNKRLHFVVDGTMKEIFFYEPIGEFILFTMRTRYLVESKAAMFLASKSGHAEPAEISRFKHFAKCLSLPITETVQDRTSA